MLSEVLHELAHAGEKGDGGKEFILKDILLCDVGVNG